MIYKILYVEDNHDNLRLVEKALESRGHEVHGALTGLDGLDLAGKIKPDVILLDIYLPDIDGYEVARRLRKSKESSLHSVTIIAITANVLAGDAEKALAAGCDMYMPKPVNIRELWERVENYLTKDSQQ